jgi:ubiquinone/menaquinone biosynthesis C-methylase UbiE
MVTEANRRARTTYNAAADSFDEPELGFWDRFGQATVDRLALREGARVLDVCAGSGASAVPAAARVGAGGRVIAVDIAENLLALALAKAQRLGLVHLSIRHSDLESLDYPDGYFNAVVNVFGVFFIPDMVAATAQMWRYVAPGGQLAITTWGPRLFEPANSIFWDAVGEVRPDLDRAYNPWDSLTDPAAMSALLGAAGVTDIRIEAVDGTHSLSSPQDFWTIVLGSGYRATHDALNPADRERVRTRTLAALAAGAVDAIETNVIYAVATRPF